MTGTWTSASFWPALTTAITKTLADFCRNLDINNSGWHQLLWPEFDEEDTSTVFKFFFFNFFFFFFRQSAVTIQWVG
jgi:hypothetical protein